jgi:hypothetical protein
MRKKIVVSLMLLAMLLGLLPRLAPALGDAASVTSLGFDEGPGSIWVNDSAAGLRGSIHGGVAWSLAPVFSEKGNSSMRLLDLGAGVNGSAWALDFDGKSGYVEFTNMTVLDSPSFSIAFWASPDTSGDWDNVMGKQLYQDGNQSGWIICWDSSSPRMLRLIVFDESHAESSSVGVPMNNGEWAHIVYIVGDGSIATYKNGVFLGQTGLRGYQPVAVPFRIGKAYGDGHYYDGLIDEVHIYGKVLNELEVRRLYKSYCSSDHRFTVVETSDVSAALGDSVLLSARLVDQKGRAAVGASVIFHMGNMTLGTVTTDSRGLAQVSLNASTAGTFPLLVETPGTIHLDGAGQVTKLVVASLNSVTQQIIVYGFGVTCLSCSLVLGLRWWRRRVAEENWRRFKERVDEMYKVLMK